MTNSQYPFVHTVAVKVTDDEWRKLQRKAEGKGYSIPELAKAALFEKVGFRTASKSPS
jgi:hypothetical protein